jgi:hypothetical protein
MDGRSGLFSFWSLIHPWSQWISGSPIFYLGEKISKQLRLLLKFGKKKNSLFDSRSNWIIKNNWWPFKKVLRKMKFPQPYLGRTYCVLKYLSSLKKEEEMWRLKSRSLWLQVGDKNTSSFTSRPKERQWRNRVEEITTQEGEVLSSIEDIKKATSTF